MEEIQRESEKNTGRREKTREVNVNIYISHRKYKERGKERKRERNKHEDIKTERGTERERERQRTRRILKNEGGGGKETFSQSLNLSTTPSYRSAACIFG